MKQEEFFFKGCDGMLVHSYCWNNLTNAKAVVQISHGLAEHAARYAGFAEWLNGRGYIVYADDHRGHGKTAGLPDDIGYLGKDGFNRIVEDVYLLTCLIREKHPGLPAFLFGHSFGSFIAQEYIARYSGGLAGAIMSGSTLKGGLELRPGLAVTMCMRLFGDKRKNPFLDRLMSGHYNDRIGNPAGRFDWLSRDEKEVAKYEADPLCGGVLTTNFFYHFLKGLLGLHKLDKISRIPKTLPICMISGDNDPVGGYGEGVKKLYKLYSGLGIEDLTVKLFEGGRHEMLNEINREEVYEYTASWLDAHL